MTLERAITVLREAVSRCDNYCHCFECQKKQQEREDALELVLSEVEAQVL